MLSRVERLLWILLLVVLAIVALHVQQAMQDQGDARAGELERRLRINRHYTDSLERALERQVPVAQRTEATWRDRWRDSIRWDTLEVTDTLWLPAQILIDADSAISSCTAALGTCLVLADSLRRARDAALELAKLRHGRAWTAAGVSYDPRTGTLGAFVDRDVWRFRVGVSVGPDPVSGGRAEVRAGVRW